MRKVKDTDYLCLSGRLHALEAHMLTRERAERLLAAQDAGEEAKILEECGFGQAQGLSGSALEQLLGQRMREAFADAALFSPDRRIVDAFRVKYDCHNLKVVVKCEASGADAGQPGLMSECGMLSAEALCRGYFHRELSGLPGSLADAAFTAREVLSRTGDARLSDGVLDGACFHAILELAGEAGCEFLADYARARIDNANLRTAIRCRRLGQSEAFLRKMLLEGGRVPLETVAEAWNTRTLDAAYGATTFADAARDAEKLQGADSMTGLERLCDNAQTDALEPGALEGFGPRVLVRYLAAVERETGALRLILTGKQAQIPADEIRERMRDLVV